MASPTCWILQSGRWWTGRGPRLSSVAGGPPDRGATPAARPEPSGQRSHRRTVPSMLDGRLMLAITRVSCRGTRSIAHSPGSFDEAVAAKGLALTILASRTLTPRFVGGYGAGRLRKARRHEVGNPAAPVDDDEGALRCDEHIGLDRAPCSGRRVRPTPVAERRLLRTVRRTSPGLPAGDRRSRCFSRSLALSLRSGPNRFESRTDRFVRSTRGSPANRPGRARLRGRVRSRSAAPPAAGTGPSTG